MINWSSPDQAEYFVKTYADLILRLCHTHSLSREDAQDVSQNIFLKLLQGSRCFADQEHEKAFVIRAALNECKDLLKCGWRRHIAPLEAASNAPAPDSPAYDDILDAVRALPAKYRDTVFLYYYEGYNLDETARLTGCLPATARQRLSRARKLLKQDLEVSYG